MTEIINNVPPLTAEYQVRTLDKERHVKSAKTCASQTDKHVESRQVEEFHYFMPPIYIRKSLQKLKFICLETSIGLRAAIDNYLLVCRQDWRRKSIGPKGCRFVQTFQDFKIFRRAFQIFSLHAA